MIPDSMDSYLKVDLPEDLTSMLQLVRIVATGSLSVVYRCLYAENMEVAVKAITVPPGFGPTEKKDFARKVKRELATWKALKHPNIVPLVGTAYGKDFGSDLPCIVSPWMTRGTLNEHVKQCGTKLSLTDRITLIRGLVVGLEYLHAQDIVHGNFHPANIVIDGECNARLTDFGFPLFLYPMQDQLSYLWTDSIRPGGPMWVAPEVLYPGLYPKLKLQATLRSDIYSLGSIILFTLSGKYPWGDRGEAENGLKKFQNPPRPAWPVNMPDGVWNFIERCWSPLDPKSRPSAQEVLSFSADKLEQLLRPNPASDINVVLFGALGSGKSSIINLLAGQPVAQISSDAEPCTERPRSYRIPLDQRQFQLWDTMGFFLAHKGPTDHLLPYKHAHAVLQKFPEGVNLILLCAHKGIITPSLRRLYWLINNFFYGGSAPIAFVATHFDTPDAEWWGRNVHDISRLTGIPAQCIPHACVTTDPTGCDQSKHALKELLQTYSTAVAPIPLRLDLSSATASLDLATHCRLASSEATALVEMFRRPSRPFNVVFFGETGAETTAIVDILVGHPAAETSPGVTTYPRSYMISTGTQHFRVWNPGMGVNEVRTGHDAHRRVDDVARLIRDLSGEDGIDLLVLCKRFGRFSPEELTAYSLFERAVCRGQSRVAVLVTHFESRHPMEKWWGTNKRELVKSMGDVIGHACIPPLAGYNPDSTKLNKALVQSRLSIEAMLEDCASSRSTRFLWPKVVSAKFTAKTITRRCAVGGRNIGINNFRDCCKLVRQWAWKLSKQ